MVSGAAPETVRRTCARARQPATSSACSRCHSSTATAGAPRADRPPQPVIVLSRRRATTSYSAAANSVGRTLHVERTPSSASSACWTTGFPGPGFTTSSTAPSEPPADAFIPFGWGAPCELLPAGNTDSWRTEQARELRSVDSRTRTRLDSRCGSSCRTPRAASASRRTWTRYWAEQRQAGPLPAPEGQPPHRCRPMAARQRGRRPTTAGSWCARVRLPRGVPDQHRRPAAREIPERRAPVTGIRRALGASRRQIFAQHLIEVGGWRSLGAAARPGARSARARRRAPHVRRGAPRGARRLPGAHALRCRWSGVGRVTRDRGDTRRRACTRRGASAVCPPRCT